MAEQTVRPTATGRTQDPAAVTADPDPQDLPADVDDDLGEADEGRNANDNMGFLQSVLRLLVDTRRQLNW